MLTRLPVRGRADGGPGAAAFAVVGALVGAVGGVPLVLIGGPLPLLAAILSISMIAVATGALHLDGLADTVDALATFGAVDAERARKDPAVGAAGVVALVCAIGVEVAALSATATAIRGAPAALVLIGAAALSRAAAVLLAFAPSRAAPPTGSAAWFVENIGRRDTVAAVVSGMAVAAVAGYLAVGLPGSVAVLGGGLVGIALAALVVRVRRQLDGDGLGAAIELTFAASLVAVAVVAAAPGAVSP